MKRPKPPVLATWLLKRSGIADGNAPLAGDLLEEFETGRSAAWYWRQTFMAIATGVYRNAWVARRYLGAFSIGYAAQAGCRICCGAIPGRPHCTESLLRP